MAEREPSITRQGVVVENDRKGTYRCIEKGWEVYERRMLFDTKIETIKKQLLGQIEYVVGDIFKNGRSQSLRNSVCTDNTKNNQKLF
ncbi:unnamed protein product [Lupinus luteus]|uniref:Uncharacterized protein n=1 Tax=Lupinus luteus TaxID=3873 RepID=A0AAV1WA19_LUPLU